MVLSGGVDVQSKGLTAPKRLEAAASAAKCDSSGTMQRVRRTTTDRQGRTA